MRTQNVISHFGITKIYDLVTKTEEELLKCRNCGHKAVNEIKTNLESMNLRLDMDIDFIDFINSPW